MALRAARSLARRPAAAAPLSTASPPEGNRRHARAALSTRSLPDYNTPVDTAKIKLSRPKPVKRKPARGDWQGLKDLRARLAAEGSLVDDTLNDMKNDKDFQLTAKKLREEGQRKLTLEEKQRRRRCLEELGAPEFTEHLLQQAGCDGTRFATEVLQLNIGLYCNQACNHCHVESSPRRHEAMSSEVADKCLDILANSPSVTTLDITGGAPELQPEFRRIVRRCRELRPDVDIIDRCNLTVLAEPGQEDLADFLADNGVHVVASLPCYSDKNVNMQRGRGVFARSIEGLRRLNEVGYGRELKLDLVYNPLGAFLPPPQDALRTKYAEELQQHFGVSFNELFTMTNMPIKRFADFLSRRGELGDYLELFVTARKSIVAARQCRLRVRRCCGAPVDASTPSPRSGTPRAAASSPRHVAKNYRALDSLVDLRTGW